MTRFWTRDVLHAASCSPRHTCHTTRSLERRNWQKACMRGWRPVSGAKKTQQGRSHEPSHTVHAWRSSNIWLVPEAQEGPVCLLQFSAERKPTCFLAIFDRTTNNFVIIYKKKNVTSSVPPLPRLATGGSHECLTSSKNEQQS